MFAKSFLLVILLIGFSSNYIVGYVLRDTYGYQSYDDINNQLVKRNLLKFRCREGYHFIRDRGEGICVRDFGKIPNV